MHPVGTVPTDKMHSGGTAPSDKMHPVETLIVFKINFVGLNFDCIANINDRAR